ncbi:MAG: hypothetical protein KUG77_08970 [Nannocystaceae bacterium]|nr:hypothetical protein [Nannocystaceae bacterium]
MRLSRLLLVLPLLSPLACDDGPNDSGETPGTTSDSGAATDSGETPATNPDGTSGNTSSGTSAPTTSASGTTTPGGETTDDGSESSTSGAMTTTSGEGEESSTGEVPTSGPGVLPGEDGMQAQCRRALECGSTYYRDEQDCIDAGVDYWGECAEATAALNNFGACMSEMDCADYNPDAYNPANTPCSEFWSDLQDAGPC